MPAEYPENLFVQLVPARHATQQIGMKNIASHDFGFWLGNRFTQRCVALEKMIAGFDAEKSAISPKLSVGVMDVECYVPDCRVLVDYWDSRYAGFGSVPYGCLSVYL